MPARHPVPSALRGRPFTVAEALAAGVSRQMLRGPSYRALVTGVHTDADADVTLGMRLEAGLLVGPPDAVITGVSGLRLRGVEVGTDLPLRFESTGRRGARRADLDVRRVQALPPRRGVLAIAEHCFVAAGRDLNLLELVTAGDWMLRLGHTTLPDLRAYVRSAAGIRGVPAARSALVYVDERVESPRETYVRLMLELAGLPRPECNLTLGDASGPVGRADMVYRRWRVIVEYDGFQHRTDIGQWERDVQRLGDFEDLGWVVVRVTNTRLNHPRAVVQRVYRKLVAAGYDGPAPDFDDRWRRLFEHRGQAMRTVCVPVKPAG